jgi:hypothetical protein
MILNDGLYIAKFRTPLDGSGGVVVVQGSAVYGGDSGMYYTGEITENGNKIEVKMQVRQHDETRMSVFGDIDQFSVTLTGKKAGKDYYFEGRSKEAPSMRFEATLTPAPK